MSTPSTRPGNTPVKGEVNASLLCVGIIVHDQKADGVAFSERTKTGVANPPKPANKK